MWEKLLLGVIRGALRLAKDPKKAHAEIEAEEKRRRRERDKRMGLD